MIQKMTTCFWTAPTLSLIRQDISHQMLTFNNIVNESFTDLATSSPEVPAVNQQLEDINRIIQTALGFLAGMLEKVQAAQGAASPFESGKKIGGMAASSATKLAGGAGAGGAIAAALTSKLFWLGFGAGVGLCCIGTDLVIVAASLATTNAAEDQAKALRKEKKIKEVQIQAENVFNLVANFKAYHQGHADEPTYFRETAKCLEHYRALSPDLQDSNAYHRIISLFALRLSFQHKFNLKFRALNQSAQYLNPQFEFLPQNQLEEEISADTLDSQDRSFSSPQMDNPPLSPQTVYIKNWTRCCRNLTKTFGLDPNVQITFIETVVNSQQPSYFQYKNHGVVQNAWEPRPL